MELIKKKKKNSSNRNLIFMITDGGIEFDAECRVYLIGRRIRI